LRVSFVALDEEQKVQHVIVQAYRRRPIRHARAPQGLIRPDQPLACYK
jgi:hypothetical protein